MKITLNTDNSIVTTSSPNIAAASLQGTGGWSFKRGQTPILRVYFSGQDTADTATAVTFGLKRSGSYDGALVFRADGELKQDENGVSYWQLKPTFSSPVFDYDLGVGSAYLDVVSAKYIGEIQYTRADGTTAATTTPTVSIVNNVIRDGSTVDLSALAAWSSITVIQMAWADFLALENKDPDALYICPDAPSEIDTHEADPDAHEEKFTSLKTELIQRISACVSREELTAITSAFLPKTQTASVAQAGIVRLGSDVPIQTSGSAPVGTTEEGQLMVAGARPNRIGVLSITQEHSGMTLTADSRLSVNVTDTTTHPDAGKAAPTATNTAGKLVVLPATQETPGAVYIATSTADERPAAVMAASQLKDYLNLINMSIATLAERVTALESAGA